MSDRYNREEKPKFYSSFLDQRGSYHRFRNYSKEAQEEEDSQNEELPERTLKRLGEAKPLRKPDVPVGMRRCEICGALVPRSRLEEHIEKSHGESSETPDVSECPECGAQVRADRLEKHLKKIHSK